MKTLLSIIILLLPSVLFAQDITGIWTVISTSEKRLPYELVISEDSGKLSGYSHITFIINGQEIVAVKKISIERNDNGIKTQDEDLIYNNFKEESPKKIRQIDVLTLTVDGTVMHLTGFFTVKKVYDLKAISGKIELEKKTISDSSKLIARLNEMNLLNTLSFLQPKRINDKAEVAALPEPKKAEEQQIIKKPEMNVQPVIVKAPPVVVPPKDTTAIAITKPKEEIKIAAPVIVPKEKPVVIPPKDTAAVVIAKPKEEIKTAPPVLKPKPIIVPPKDTTAIAIAKPKPVVPVAPPKPQPVVVKPKPVPPPVVKVTPPPVVKPQPVAVAKPKPAPPVVKAPPATTPVAVIKPTAKTTKEFIPLGSAKDIANRKIENIETLYFESDSINITLYDDGYVDGDSVSILLNGVVLLGKQGLSITPIKKTIYTTDYGDSLQFIMYAENLGSIPPNTGLMILQDGKTRHEIRFSGDLQKNAAITLRRKPKDDQ